MIYYVWFRFAFVCKRVFLFYLTAAAYLCTNTEFFSHCCPEVNQACSCNLRAGHSKWLAVNVENKDLVFLKHFSYLIFAFCKLKLNTEVKFPVYLMNLNEFKILIFFPDFLAIFWQLFFLVEISYMHINHTSIFRPNISVFIRVSTTITYQNNKAPSLAKNMKFFIPQ